MAENSKLQERQKTLQGEFDKLTVEAKLLVDQGRTINKRLSEIAARKGQIQGAYSEISSLLGKEEMPKEKVEEPKEAKEEKKKK